MAEASEILLITGPAGAGKTSVANEWARTRPYPRAHISLDDVRLLVKPGYADPQDGWRREQGMQLELARGSAALLARRFMKAGIGCVIDDAIFPDSGEGGYPAWSRELDGARHRVIVLLPSLAAAIDRNGRREGIRHLNPEMLETIYARMASWRENELVPVIDNSCLSVSQTILAVATALGQHHTQAYGAGNEGGSRCR